MTALGTLLLAAVMAAPPAGNSKSIPGQQTLIVIGDTFRFVEGSLARYSIFDKSKRETYVMDIAVLGQEKKMDKKKVSVFRWMEVRVEMPKNPVVVTRFLADETPRGPGDLQDVVVQVHGYAAFRVPKKFYQEKSGQDKQEVAPVRPAQVVKRVEKKSIVRNGRTLEVIEVEALDGSGKPVSATVSEELPPIGVCLAETEDVRMDLVDWGMNAKSRITGSPMNFYLWIMDQVMSGLAEPEQKQ